MNQGLVSSHFPYLPLRIVLDQSAIVVEALVDTGFDGALVLPVILLRQLSDAEPDAYSTWRLADGSEVISSSYRVTVELLGIAGSFAVLTSVLGDEPIVGRGITDRYRVILDHGERVIVEA